MVECMYRRLLALAAAAGLLLTASACTPTPPPETAPSQAQVVGSTYAHWHEGEQPELGGALYEYVQEEPGPLMIASEAEWQAWLDALPAPLDDEVFPHRPDFSASVIVVGTYYDCRAEPGALWYRDGGRLSFFVAEDEVEVCEPSPRAVLLTLVEFEELGVSGVDEVNFASA